jgi:MFS family permease
VGTAQVQEQPAGQRDLRLLLAAWTLNLFGDQLAVYVLALRAHSSGYSAVGVAAVLIAGQLPVVALSGPAGALADRVDSRRLFIVIPLLQAAIASLLVVTSGIVVPAALLFALGCGTAVLQPAISAVIPTIAGTGTSLARAMAGLSVAAMLGNAAGALSAGIVVEVANARTALFVDALSFIALTGLLAAMGTVRRPAGAAGDPRTRVSAGFRHLLADPALRTVVAILTAAFFVASVVNVVEVFYIKDVLKAGDLGFGVLIAAGIAATSAGALLAGRLTTAENAAVMSLSAVPLLGASFIIAAAVPRLPVALAAYVAGGLANGALIVGARTLVASRTDDAIRGRAFAALGACVQGAQLVAFGTGGLLGGCSRPGRSSGWPVVAVTGVGLVGLTVWRAAVAAADAERLGGPR